MCFSDLFVVSHSTDMLLIKIFRGLPSDNSNHKIIRVTPRQSMRTSCRRRYKSRRGVSVYAQRIHYRTESKQDHTRNLHQDRKGTKCKKHWHRWFETQIVCLYSEIDNNRVLMTVTSFTCERKCWGGQPVLNEIKKNLMWPLYQTCLNSMCEICCATSNK